MKLEAQRVPGVEGACHHPRHRFIQVSNAIHARRFRIGAPSGRGQAGGLQEAEFSRPADCRAAALNAELAVHGALVGLDGIERDVEPRTDLTAR